MSKMFNRMWNVNNPYQGNQLRVLCVCSAGLLRSPTAAHLLSLEPYSFNTRAVGVDADHALIPIDDVLVHWADAIVCMDKKQSEVVDRIINGKKLKYFDDNREKSIIVLNIEDSFSRNHSGLVSLLEENFKMVNWNEICERNSREVIGV